ncbi:MAG: leucine-rich repeat protein [Oscillospiraceae bacterium]|nr:leucine-rich repeat protein [Oscillospiraceae bacterium]
MKIKARPICAVMLAAAMLLCCFPLMAFNAGAANVVDSGECGDGFGLNSSWILYDDGHLVIKGSGNIESFDLPWSPYKNKIKSVTIEKGITRISWYAFSGCSSLESVIIQDGFISITNQMFYGCSSLKSIKIPDSVTFIGNNAFYNCSSLKSVSIPKSTKNIEIDAFSGCSSLEEINVDNGNLYFASVEGVLFNKSLTSLILCPEGKKGVYTIPAGVTSIGNWAFNDCASLTSVTLPDSMTKIDDYAFWCFSGLTNIEMPNSVTSIGNNAFYCCTGLTSITIPESVISIDSATFITCTNMTYITIPSSVSSIGHHAFGKIYYYVDGGAGEVGFVDNFKIYCYKDTAGHQYALDNGFDFELLDGEIVPETITSAEHKTENGFISGIAAGVTLEGLLGGINEKPYVKVFVKDGQEVTDKNALMCTGMTVKLMDGDKATDEAVIAVKGDITDTGEIDASDARAILRHVAKLDELNGAYYEAADLKGDGDVDAANARMILRYVAKLETSL